MEKVKCYRALIEYKEEVKNGESTYDYIILGIFKTIRDAECAAKLYRIAFNNTVGKDDSKRCTDVFKVEGFDYPKEYVKNANIMQVQDFINQNSVIKNYSAKVGDVVMGNLLKESGLETQEEKELRIIESLINDYKNKLSFALRASGISDKTIEGVKETLDYLEGVRNSKRNLGE